MSLPVPTGFLSKKHVFNPFLQNDRVESFSLLDVAAVERDKRRVYTSLTQMKGLLRLESALSRSLDSYLEQRSGTPGIIRQFADHARRKKGTSRRVMCLPSDQLLLTSEALYKALDKIRVIPHKRVSKR